MSWPARMAFSMAGITVSSYPTMPGKDRLLGGEPRHQVVAQLLLHGARTVAGGAQRAEGGGQRGRGRRHRWLPGRMGSAGPAYHRGRREGLTREAGCPAVTGCRAADTGRQAAESKPASAGHQWMCGPPGGGPSGEGLAGSRTGAGSRGGSPAT